MRKDFFEIQAAERRKIWFLSAVFFLAYFIVFFLITFAVAHLLEPTLERAFVRSFFPSIILAIATLAIQLWFADQHGVRIILDKLSALSPDPEDFYHQRLIRLIDEIGVAAGGIRTTPVVVPTLAANAFALADRNHAVIGITEGAVSSLSRAQTQAIIAHEMAHIVNNDCRLATWICAMAAPFVALADALDKLDEAEQGVRNQAVGTVVRTIIALLTFVLSRKREMRADAKAVELTRDPLAAAEAIYRISTTNHFVIGTAGFLSPIFILPSKEALENKVEEIFEGLFSTHPPPQKRLDMLLQMAGSNMEELSRRLETRSHVAPAESLDNQMAERQQWEFQVGDKWMGPFSLAALAEQTGFGPHSWVRRTGENGEEFPAYVDPLIARRLRHPSSTAATALGLCPRCSVDLERVIYEGLPVGKCRSCGGYLVTEMRVRRLLKRREVEFSEQFMHEVEQWLEKNYVARYASESLETEELREPCQCPVCKKPMFRRFYSYQYFIPVDRCLECSQIWFDSKELELLQALIERKNDGNASPSILNPVPKTH